MLPMTMHDNQAAERWQMHFSSDPKCVSLVRRQVTKALTKWGCAPDDIDRAVLVCSELATNAIQHGHRAGHRFEVGVTVDGSDCLIEVSDSGTGAPRLVVAEAEDEHGRGLALVTALADGTGYRPDGSSGNTAWARLALGSWTLNGLRPTEESVGR